MLTIQELDQRRRESKGRLIGAIYRMVKEERGSDGWNVDLEIVLTAATNVVNFTELIAKRRSAIQAEVVAEIVDLTTEQLTNV